MKYKLAIELPGLPKTINAIGRKHWAIKTKEVNYWKECVALATIGKRPAKPLKKAHLVLTRFSSVAPDPDGLVASFKAVQDALIGLIIENDMWENIGMPDYQWYAAPKGKGKIRIEVIALPEGTEHKGIYHSAESYTCPQCGHRSSYNEAL